VKFNRLHKMFQHVKVLSGSDNVLKLDMLGGTVHISTVRDKTQVEMTDTVDVQWQGNTDEVEAFGFMIIENVEACMVLTICSYTITIRRMYISMSRSNLPFRQIVRCFC
jgi:hypothetical protein